MEKNISEQLDTMSLRDFLLWHGFLENDLLALATIFHFAGVLDGCIRHDEMLLEDFLAQPVVFDEVHKALQKNLFQRFRGAGERQQIGQVDELDSIRDRLLDAFQSLGFLAPAELSSDVLVCNYGLIFGASQSAMAARLDTMLDVVQVTGEVVFLVGDRPLWVDAEPCCVDLLLQAIARGHGNDSSRAEIQAEVDALWRDCAADMTVGAKRIFVRDSLVRTYGVTWPTESDAAKYMVEQKYLQDQLLPSIQYISAPLRADGSRPDTIDTVVAFAAEYKERLKSGVSVVAVSSYPFVREQALTLKLLPSEVMTRTIGYDAVGCLPALVETLLSGFAGYFYKYKHIDAVNKRRVQELQCDAQSSVVQSGSSSGCVASMSVFSEITDITKLSPDGSKLTSVAQELDVHCEQDQSSSTSLKGSDNSRVDEDALQVAESSSKPRRARSGSVSDLGPL